MWNHSYSAGQDSSPCRPDDLTYDQLQQEVAKTSCTQANFGVEAGGGWCDPGSPTSTGTYGVVCMYEARVSSLGTTSALGATESNDYMIAKPNAACSEGLPAYTFDRRMTYKGVEYRVAGSCPAKPILGVRSSNPAWKCTLSTVTPGGQIYETASYSQLIGDIGVLWEIPALNPTAEQHIMNFIIQTDRSTTACSRNAGTSTSPSIFNDIRVNATFSHRELQNYN